MKRKICVVTGSRAEYGLLYWLMKEVSLSDKLDLQLIVTGMHLSSEFGLTYKEIEKNFTIDRKIDILLSSDSNVSTVKSMALAQLGFAESFEQLKPDIIVVLGDRFEIFSAVSSAMILNIPVAHLDGGEVSSGSYDEYIRHSITKMSHLHFTGTEEFRNRVIQLGENPANVFCFGATGIDSIKNIKFLSKTKFEESIQFVLNKHNLLITYHPVTLEKEYAKIHFTNLLEVLDQLENTNLIFTHANCDAEGREINKMITHYVQNNQDKSVSFESLGQLRYLSALQYVDAVVGNSSSGLIEVPFFKKGTINIGNRQKGRTKGKSVIDCSYDKESIFNAIKYLYSTKFQANLKTVQNVYGDGDASSQICKVLCEVDLTNILQKKFYDISC